ncbi:MAG: carbamoyltransferase HypF [Armatimonadota bacterium]
MGSKLSQKFINKNIRVTGVVQGVGFRPFIFNLAKKHNLKGYVLNDNQGVFIEVEGAGDIIDKFINSVKEESPAASRIDSVLVNDGNLSEFSDFEIKESRKGEVKDINISPDLCICRDCSEELFDKENFRYRYPFINCTNCGPRFSIVTDVPYDRANTSMKDFKMCHICENEYGNPEDRRFHAQPNACSKCGPVFTLYDNRKHKINDGDPITMAVDMLKVGKIIAVKGIGGYHLAVDAQDNFAVKQLRERKFREDKPFALMAKNIDMIKQVCYVSEKEEELLKSPASPIVLLKKKNKGILSDFVAPRHKTLGFMLPYTPAHKLIAEESGLYLVMTSANKSNEPIYYKDEDAFYHLRDIADYFLMHNRDIVRRCDDSVVRAFNGKAMTLRRSRGYVPNVLLVPGNFKKTVLALGAHLKNTFSYGFGSKAVVSHYIGDLDNLETYDAFTTGIEDMGKIFNVKAEVLVHDLHPDYLSTQHSYEQNLPQIGVQHHHAHIAACMCENNLDEKVIGIAWDGTGLGTDGNIWGSEFMIADYNNFERVAHFDYMNLPGGEKAIQEPWRMAFSILYDVYREDLLDFNFEFLKQKNRDEIEFLLDILKKNVNVIKSSGMGRLFDAVSALLGLCGEINYEGQAAIELELAINPQMKDYKNYYNYKNSYDCYPYEISYKEIIAQIVNDIIINKLEVSSISAKFHNTLAMIIFDVVLRLSKEKNINKVVLSGGTFQNMYLLERVYSLLSNYDFEVYTHSTFPPNDGCISLGQLMVAKKRQGA